MICDILLRVQPDGRFTATALGVPDCTVEGQTREEALAKVRSALVKILERAEVVQLEITPTTTISESERCTWVQELYAMFAPVRGDARELTETEVDTLIDEAITEVRAKRD
jgi:predicted RNase H-like HicB family nuclease